MKVFRDGASREWEISLNISSVRRVLDLADIDLTKLHENNFEVLGKLDQELTLAKVVAVLCFPQAQRLNVSAEAFDELLDGPTLGAAQEALLAELENFFQGSKKTAYRTTMSVIRQMETKATTQAENLNAEKVAAEVLSVLIVGEKSTVPPAESASTPAA